VRAAGALVVLFVFWLLLSGYFTPFLMGAGIVCAALVVAFTRRMQLLDREGYPLHLVPRALLSYWPWLLWEICKSAWDVSRIVVHPRLPISPTMTRVPATQRSDLGRTAYANSITLTPGTIAIEAEGGEILVHALTREAARGLDAGDMDRRVTAFEGRR